MWGFPLIQSDWAGNIRPASCSSSITGEENPKCLQKGQRLIRDKFIREHATFRKCFYSLNFRYTFTQVENVCGTFTFTLL